MICPHCQKANLDNPHFCGHCGAALAQAVPPAQAMASPAAPVAKPSGSGKTVLIVLGVVFGVLLILVISVHAAFRAVVNKVSSLANGDAQSTQQQRDGSASASDSQHGVQTAGNVIGNVLGTDAKGKSDIGNALNNMVQAGSRIEQHDKAGGNTSGAPDASDTQQAMGAAGGLLSALGGSLGGAHRHDPVDFHNLEALLPSTLAGMQRGTPRGRSSQAMGIKASSAEVDFQGAGNARVNISIKDATAVSGLAGLASMANSDESEQGDSYEKNQSIDGRSVHETWDAQGKHGVISLIVAKRFGVDVEGDNVDMDALKSALAQVDVAKLESMKDSNPQAQ